MARDQVELPIQIASSIARVDGAVGFTRDGSCFANLATWPPAITRRAEYALDAARGPTGTWLVYARLGTTWSLRWYESIAAAEPVLVEKEPVPRRAFEPFTVDLDKTSKSIELAHKNRIESVHLCGELAVVVPRHVGLGELRHPYVKRDGRWRQVKKLPPFTKTTKSLSTRCATAALRLGDGTDVLIWDGYVYASDGKKFTQRFEERLDLRWYHAYEPVASPSGLYACDGDVLVELSSLGRRELLPGVKASSVHRGPDDTLLVETSDGLLLVAPRENWKAVIPEELIGRRYNIIGATHDGGLVAFGGPDYNLAHIPASELASLPRVDAAEPPPAIVVPPAPTLDNVGAASRPLLAGHGDKLVIALGTELRWHDEDRIDGRLDLGSEIVAIAHDGERVAAVFVDGALRTLTDAKHRKGKSHQLREPPRSLAVGPDGSWLVLTAARVWQIDLAPRVPKLVEIPFTAPLAAATDPNGTVLLAGEGSRLATWSNGTLVELPPALEQIVACVAVAPGRFICGGERHLFQLVIESAELEVLESGDVEEAFATAPTPHLAASPDGKRLAWCTSPQAVRIAALRGTRVEVVDNVQYPSEFSAPDEPLAVRGLAFLTDHQLAIGLDHGRGNIIDLAATSACKLDPHPGDVPSRWIFLYGDNTLVAD